MRGIVQLPLESGMQELGWYVGKAPVAGTSLVSTVTAIQTDRDADFVAKRLWLVQWPTFGPIDISLKLPAQSSVKFSDGGTKRALSLVPGGARSLALDCDVNRATGAWLGLPNPFLIRANNNLFAEIINPGAAGTPWVGDVYMVIEGYKIYPSTPDPIPRTVQTYALPFSLDGNAIVQDPSLAGANVQGQVATITNNGEGDVLAKGFQLQIIDGAGLDKTADILPMLGLNIKDSTSGYKNWIRNPNAAGTLPLIPASILTMHQAFLPFNTPRFIDKNANIEVQILFPTIAAAIAALSAAGTWPMTFTFNLYGTQVIR